MFRVGSTESDDHYNLYSCLQDVLIMGFLLVSPHKVGANDIR